MFVWGMCDRVTKQVARKYNIPAAQKKISVSQLRLFELCKRVLHTCSCSKWNSNSTEIVRATSTRTYVYKYVCLTPPSAAWLLHKWKFFTTTRPWHRLQWFNSDAIRANACQRARERVSADKERDGECCFCHISG